MKKLGLLGLCVGFFTSLFSQNADSTLSAPPYFRGCEHLTANSDNKKQCSDEALVNFIAATLEYPETAVANKVQGTVVVSFDLTEKGMVENAKVEHDIGAGCGQAALNVVESMPKWEAAFQAGSPVKTRLTLPVRFAFEDKKSDHAYSLHWGSLQSGKLSKSELKANLEKPIIVRDPFGNAVPVSDFQVSLERGKRSVSAQTTGNTLTKKMKKLIKKAKKGGTLNLSAAVQKGATFVVLNEEIRIEK